MTNQSRLQLSLFIIATLPPLNETNVVTFFKNKVILRMFQIILTLGVPKPQTKDHCSPREDAGSGQQGSELGRGRHNSNF